MSSGSQSVAVQIGWVGSFAMGDEFVAGYVTLSEKEFAASATAVAATTTEAVRATQKVALRRLDGVEFGP